MNILALSGDELLEEVFFSAPRIGKWRREAFLVLQNGIEVQIDTTKQDDLFTIRAINYNNYTFRDFERPNISIEEIPSIVAKYAELGNPYNTLTKFHHLLHLLSFRSTHSLALDFMGQAEIKKIINKDVKCWDRLMTHALCTDNELLFGFCIENDKIMPTYIRVIAARIERAFIFPIKCLSKLCYDDLNIIVAKLHETRRTHLADKVSCIMERNKIMSNYATGIPKSVGRKI